MNQGGVLSPVIFSFAVEYVVKHIQENLEELEWTGVHQLLVCADDINL
jgi:hypothetical protein